MRLIDADELLEKHTCDVYGAYDDSCMLKAVFVPYIKGAPTVDGTPKWIPLTEKMPDKNNQWVLCLCVGGAMEVLKFDYTMWNWDSQYPGRCYMESYVTHWMPLPEPPKEDHHEAYVPQ